MLTPRSFFVIGTIDGRVYAAGGSGGGGGVLYNAVVVGGKLLVTEGWVCPFLSSLRGQVYDPGADRWEPMVAGLREGWTGRSVVIGGRHLFVVSEHEGMRLKAYDAGSDTWGAVEGSPVVPEGIRGPVSVSSSGRRIFVVGRGLHVVIGHVQRTVTGGFSIRWEHVDAPEGFCDLTPSHAKEEKEMAHLYERRRFPYPGDKEAVEEFIKSGGTIGTTIGPKGFIDSGNDSDSFQKQLQSNKFEQEAQKLWLRMRNEVIAELQEKGFDVE